MARSSALSASFPPAAGDRPAKSRFPKTSPPRAAEYALHPVLFDGALQVFSAGAATVEDRRARMKLPVRFARILFLRSPGASRPRARERGGVATENFWKATSRSTTKQDSHACSSMAFARSAWPVCAAAAGRRHARCALSCRLGADARATRREPLAPAPLAQLHEAAQRALEEVIASRGRATLEAAILAGDDLTAVQLARGLREMGVRPAPR